jgi:hypothetical protein
MIIASKGHVRLNGSGADVLTEFTTIAAAIMNDDEDVTPDLLKILVDAGQQMNEDRENDKRND